MRMSKVGPKGQVVLPRVLRDALHIAPGDRVTFSLEHGRVFLVPVRTATVSELRGSLRAARAVDDVQSSRQQYQDHLVTKYLGDDDA